MSNKSTTRFVYRIDRSDRLTFMKQEALEFARANEAPDLSEQAVLGRTLWDFIAGEDVRQIYKILFARIRNGAHIPPLPFRCDSPQLRRFMSLTMRLLEDDQIELEGVLVKEQVREEVQFVDCAATYSDNDLTMRSWCKKIEVSPNRWVEIEEAIGAGLWPLTRSP